MLDLWPKSFGTSKVPSPVNILREQAVLLGQKTKNIVQARVEEYVRREGFAYGFFLIAPVLGNYHYKLLTIFHDIDLYPVEVHVEDSIFDEASEKFQVSSDEVGNHLLAKSEEEFIEILRVVFNSRKSTQVINTLLSQADFK